MRTRFLSFCVVMSGVAAVGVLTASSARSQISGRASVNLQAVTPGASQSGHANISGIMRAGIFAGSGSGLTNVPWSSIIGAPTSAPPSGPAGGDLDGTYPNPTVDGIQGRPVASTTPTVGAFLGWNGSTWLPGTSAIAFTNLNASQLTVGTVPDARLGVGGDIVGPLSAASIVGLRGRPLSTVAPNPGQVLRWSGVQWYAADDGFALPFSAVRVDDVPVLFGITHTLFASSATVIRAESQANVGIGVHGIGRTGVKGTATDGDGIYAEGLGADGRALRAQSAGSNHTVYVENTGTGGGMEIRNNSTTTEGLKILGLATSGSANGLSASINAPDGDAVRGSVNSAGPGTGVGVSGFSAKDSGYGGAFSTATSGGSSIGVTATTRGFTGTGVEGQAILSTGANFGGKFSTTSPLGTGLRAMANSTTGETVAGVFLNYSADGTGVSSQVMPFGVAGTGRAYYGKINGSGQTLFKGDMLFAGSTQFGVDLAANVLNGAGFRLNQTRTGFGGEFFGLDISVQTDNGAAIRANSEGTNAPVFVGENTGIDGEGIKITSRHRAIFAESTNITSNTFNAVHAVSRNREGAAVYGFNSNTVGGSYITRGVYGEVAGPTGRAVTGQATANTGPTFGGRFTSQSDAGIGVYAGALNNTGGTVGVFAEVDSRLGVGVYARSNSTNLTSAAMALHASDPNMSPNSYGAFVSGSSGGSIKSFVIDHPLDPLNKTLKHFCNESPVPYNTYKGSVRTDGKGYATVELPNYFESLNKDGTVTLTVVDDGDSDDFVMAKVVGGGIQNGQFRIRTSLPNTQVHWRVDAVRNDAYIRAHPPVTELPKPSEWRGKYYNPEAFGQDETQGIFYRPSMKDKEASSSGSGAFRGR